MKPLIVSQNRCPIVGVGFALWLTGTMVYGQGSATYPYVSPTAAASGMTTGLENGSTSATMNMMQVRAAAQESERAAAAAAMARTAESAIEEQGLKTALQKARETRQAKIEASERLKWQKVTAYNAYNSVSSGEMATWKDAEGNVKVGRGLPSDFVNSVKAEEAARAAAAPQKKGFTPLKSISDKVTEAVGIDEPISDTGLSSPKPLPADTMDNGSERSGLFGIRPPSFNISKIKAPKLGFSKLANRTAPAPAPAAPQPSAPPAQAAASAVATASASASATATSAAPSPAPAPQSTAPVTIQNSRSGSEMIRDEAQTPQFALGSEKKKGGLFSRMGFGKKEAAPPSAEISNSLFPTGMVPSQPSGGTASVSGGRTIVSLPGSQPEPKKRFSLSKPKLSVPKIASGSNGMVSPTSTINQNGNSYYVVNSTSQFMKYGESRDETSIRAVNPGTVVMMTKPGAEWATVQLNDGSTGIIQTKNLRGANAGEFPR